MPPKPWSPVSAKPVGSFTPDLLLTAAAAGPAEWPDAATMVAAECPG